MEAVKGVCVPKLREVEIKEDKNNKTEESSDKGKDGEKSEESTSEEKKDERTDAKGEKEERRRMCCTKCQQRRIGRNSWNRSTRLRTGCIVRTLSRRASFVRSTLN